MTDILKNELSMSNCPRCGTRLMCGKIIVTGYHRCPKCKRHWIIEIAQSSVKVTEAYFHFKSFA
ncbi:hypothetical protein B5F27_02050 [Faecalibacterium sp. An192]|nr:hypothetical protein B5F27_02050 [Faecalibacterium sp. An192]